jgi:hypothetical protein
MLYGIYALSCKRTEPADSPPAWLPVPLQTLLCPMAPAQPTLSWTATTFWSTAKTSDESISAKLFAPVLSVNGAQLAAKGRRQARVTRPRT